MKIKIIIFLFWVALKIYTILFRMNFLDLPICLVTIIIIIVIIIKGICDAHIIERFLF